MSHGIVPNAKGIVLTVLIGAENSCETCGRRLYKRGIVLLVEAAVNPLGVAEIVGQLNELAFSPNRRRRDRHADLMERFSQFASYGQLEVPGEMRRLEAELWEIKTAEDRVPFYRRSTPGHKLAARVMFLFEKSTGKTAEGKTPRKYIDRGNWYMKGDSERDTI